MTFDQSLRKWFFAVRRNFPWREEKNPYRVWVSEVMLQQTRASVVVEYFQRWMERFPDVTTLALASEEEVIKIWEGLGYYSRARNLHRGAKKIVEQWGGQIPEELEGIAGIGPYTRGAILSFGFHKRAAAVDGNVARVLARYDAIEQEIDQPKVRKALQARMLSLLEEKEPWVTAEALIELGATLCTPKKPKCQQCPIQQECQSKKEGREEELPFKKKGPLLTELQRTVLVVEAEQALLIQQREENRLMAGLYEFPYVEGRLEAEKILSDWGLEATEQILLPKVTHTFTRYRAHLFPTLLRVPKKILISGFTWADRPEQLPFSSGHRRILLEAKKISQR